MPVIWMKTDAGRAEMQARAVVKERAQRNLLLLIDGRKTDELLLAHVTGISAADFITLHGLGLIEPQTGIRRPDGVDTLPAPLPPGPDAGPSTLPGPLTGPSTLPGPLTEPATGPLTEPMSDSQRAALDTLPMPITPEPLGYPEFTATLAQIISTELGLRGFTLSLAIQKASTIEQLREVAERVLEQVRERRGEEAATRARRSLYGAA